VRDLALLALREVPRTLKPAAMSSSTIALSMKRHGRKMSHRGGRHASGQILDSLRLEQDEGCERDVNHGVAENSAAQ